MLSPGQTVPVAIEKPAAGGRMIARVDGQVVLVADAIPGERVQARVERIGKGVVYAQTLSVDEPSARSARSVSPIRCAAAASTATSPIRGSSRSRRR